MGRRADDMARISREPTVYRIFDGAKSITTCSLIYLCWIKKI